MLDKSQIQGWEGAPEAKPEAPQVTTLAVEGVTPEPVRLTPEQMAARRKRSLWIALALGVFVILVFVITITRMSPDQLQDSLL